MRVEVKVLFKTDNILLVKIISPFQVHYNIYTPWGYQTYCDYSSALVSFNERLEELN